MKTIKFQKDCTFKGEYYFVGDVFTPSDITEVYKLNEKGYIEPMNLKELKTMEKEINKKEIKIDGNESN